MKLKERKKEKKLKERKKMKPKEETKRSQTKDRKILYLKDNKSQRQDSHDKDPSFANAR